MPPSSRLSASSAAEPSRSGCSTSPRVPRIYRSSAPSRDVARVVTFGKRGQGLSDGISGAPSLAQRVDDVRAIMDDIGSQRAVLLGFSEGSPMSAFFAAVNPERMSKLILFGGFAKAF